MKLVMGGSFDPVHIGHLRVATELAEKLGCQVYLMPCAQAVHKTPQTATTIQRLDMLRLAVHDNPLLEIDEREINRKSESYTITSLKELRVEGGDDQAIVFVMGSDSAATLSQWKDADQFSRLAHFLVLSRPGQTEEACLTRYKSSFESLGLVYANTLAELSLAPSGLFFELPLSELDISSSQIRDSIQQKRSIRYIVPDAVEQYICDNNLYRP